MRVLILQFVAPSRGQPRPEFHHELGVAVALLRAEGFDVALAAFDGYSPDRLRSAIHQHRPARMLVDVPATRVTAARHSIVDVAEEHLLPVTVVGRYATCQPEQAISIPGVAELIQGEYEPSLLRLYQSVRDGWRGAEQQLAQPGPAARPAISGVWFNSEDGLVRAEPAPLVQDLDALPFPDRDIFDYGQAVADTGRAAFSASRGCDQWCSHCLNDWHVEMYAGKGPWLRRRSVGNLLEEVAAVVDRYRPVKEVAFCDHPFASDLGWLEEFAGEYPRRCSLPYRCHVRLNRIDEQAAGLLAGSGCRVVDAEIGSGSSFIRDEVLTLRTSEDQIVESVRALKRAGLKVHGRVFVGAPYDSEIAVEETLALLARLKLDRVRARVFFPVPGTRAAEMCAENGWISGRGEDNLFADRSVLDMPAFPGERIDKIARRFHVLLKRRRGRSLRVWLRRLRSLGTRPLRLARRGDKPGRVRRGR